MNLARFREILWREDGDRHSVLWLFAVNNILGLAIFPARIRTQLLRLFIPGIDRRAIVRAGVWFRSGNVTIGPSSLIGYRVMFDTRQPTVIGANVAIGPNVTFVDTDHEMSNPQRRAGASRVGSITVGDGSRISTGSIVLLDVKIGEGVAVGAGSLVRADCEPHSLYVGTPARKLRDLPTTVTA